MSLGDKIKARREGLGQTQASLADHTGMTVETISRIERNITKQPSLSCLRKIAHALDTTMEELMYCPSPDSLIIAVDFDGMIAEYGGTEHLGCGEVMPGAKAILQKWADEGCHIIVHTSRSDLELVRKYLQWHELSFHEICSKPHAHLYIDDRGLRFESWDAADEFLQLNREQICIKRGAP